MTPIAHPRYSPRTEPASAAPEPAPTGRIFRWPGSALFQVAAFALLPIPPAQGEIRWDQPLVELAAPTGEKLVRTEFRFRNAGSVPISLISIQPSCGCVATSLAKTTYGPGEAGEIKVTFDLSMDGLAGIQERTIAVTADDHSPPALLRLRVTATNLAEAIPARLSWARGEVPRPKIAVVSPGTAAAIALTQPFRGSRDFDVKIAPQAGGLQYRVEITPKTTATPSFAQIHLRATAATAAPEELMLYAEVN